MVTPTTQQSREARARKSGYGVLTTPPTTRSEHYRYLQIIALFNENQETGATHRREELDGVFSILTSTPDSTLPP
jgi:hypothetical protein